MKVNAKEIIAPAAVLLVICLTVTLLLAGTNGLTKDKIAEVNAMAQQKSMSIVLADCEKYEPWDAGETECYAGFASDGSIKGYVFITYDKGYGGEISVMTGIDKDGVITGAQVMNCSETPGLGLKSKNADFTNQYIGKSGELSVIKGGNAGEGEISAITGATITSKAVTRAVNAAQQCFSENIKEGLA